MAWNEPGGNDNDPWGNRNNSGGGGNNSGGPPDLDEVFKNLKKRFNSLFGGQGGSGNGSLSGSSGGGMPGGKIGGYGLMALAVIGLMLWIASGIYIVEPAQAGVVTRFGAHTKTTNPGIHWHMPWPIENVERVDVELVRSAKMNQQITLTQDENLVKITLSVQYIIKNAEDYLFKVSRPDTTLEQVVESAVRAAIGQANMEAILTTAAIPEAEEGDDKIETEVVDTDALQKTVLVSVQSILDEYETGLEITAVSLEEAQPPDEVQAAFSDAIKAREDKERIISQAEAYQNEILPIARGDAERIIQEAEGYKTRVEQSALGESRRFLSLLAEFEKAPEVTRERLYIEAMESVLSNTSKVLVDSNEGNSLMYLPIDKLINQGGNNNQGISGSARPNTLNSSTADAPRFSNTPLDETELNRDSTRSRDRGALR